MGMAPKYFHKGNSICQASTLFAGPALRSGQNRTPRGYSLQESDVISDA
jgi:hypothetical protein